MIVHQKTSECTGVVNVHCLLCVKAMECPAYLCELYPIQREELVLESSFVTTASESCAKRGKGD